MVVETVPSVDCPDLLVKDLLLLVGLVEVTHVGIIVYKFGLNSN